MIKSRGYNNFKRSTAHNEWEAKKRAGMANLAKFSKSPRRS